MLTRVEFHASETLQSFLSRTAAVNGAGDMRSLLKHLGTNWSQISSDTRFDGRNLAADLGISAARLDHAKFRRIGRTRVSVNGHEFKAGSFRSGPHRYCPLCLVHDMTVNTGSDLERPFARLPWALANIDACAVHGVRLAVTEDFGRASNDFVRCVSSRWAVVDYHASRCEAVELKASDLYFSDRLGGGSIRVPLLDELTFQAALDLCEHVGCHLEHGCEILSVSQQAPETRARLRQDGFHLIAQGEEALRNHLSDSAKRYWATAAWHPRSSLFGNLYQLLDRNVDAYPKLTGLLRGIAQEHLPLGPEDIFLGAPCERRIHTISTISRHYKIPRPTVRAMLSRADLLDTSHRFKGDADIAFGKDVLRDEFEHEAHLIGHVALVRRMGLSDFTDTCIFDPSCDFALRTRSTVDRGELYSVGDAEQLFDRLTKSVAAGGDDFVTIRDAARLALTSPNEVIQLLAGGALKSVAGFGRHFFGIKVSYLEVRGKTQARYDATVLHYEEVAHELIISVALANTLMRERKLPVSIVDLPGFSKTYPVISRAALEVFRGEYISLNECAAEKGLQRGTLIKCLEDATVCPSIATDGGVPVFYRKQDIERALAGQAQVSS